MKSRAGRAAAGFTLIEMVLGVTILAVLAKVTISASQTSSSMTEVGNIEAEMFRHGERVMKAIMTDLRMSGEETLNGNVYPHIYVDGEAGPGFDFFDHEAAPSAALAGDADFGPRKSIVLCLPSDLDGDGRPELDADGKWHAGARWQPATACPRMTPLTWRRGTPQRRRSIPIRAWCGATRLSATR